MTTEHRIPHNPSFTAGLQNARIAAQDPSQPPYALFVDRLFKKLNFVDNELVIDIIKRTADASERTYDLLRTYLCANDPQFVDLLAGRLPEADDLAAPPDVTFDEGRGRDEKHLKLEALRQLYTDHFGSEPSDEAVVLLYEEMYERDSRTDADAAGPRVNSPIDNLGTH